jgi:hypothetical protein
MKQDLTTFWAATEHVPGTLSREQYEAACVAAGRTPRADSDCDTYGVRYGDFQMGHYTVEYQIDMELAHRRLNGIDSERVAYRAAHPRPARTTVACPNCGSEVGEGMLMNANFGTACPNCWDSMNDEDGFGA